MVDVNSISIKSNYNQSVHRINQTDRRYIVVHLVNTFKLLTTPRMEDCCRDKAAVNNDGSPDQNLVEEIGFHDNCFYIPD